MNDEIQNKINNLASKIKEKLFKSKKLFNEHKDIEPLLSDMWNLSKEKFVLETELKERKKYKGIIFTVGFSPEPIILNILANKPECVYFIYTEKSEPILDIIIKETSLKLTQCKRELMKRDSAAEAYNLVKKGLKFLNEDKKLAKDSIALDPTGGTKIMSVGCGIAASIFNINILYVNTSIYDPQLRRPKPGTESLVHISNPFDIYQDDKIIEGLKFLKNQDFISGRDLFYNIKELSSNPIFPEFLACISNILHFWDMIDYDNALKYIKKAKLLMQKLGGKISSIQNEILNYLNSWEKYLIIIYSQIRRGDSEIEKISLLLIFDIKTNADRKFYKTLYNNAALKYYRAIEMINQYVLYNKYNFDTQNPNYDEIIEEAKTKLKNSTGNNELNIQQIILKQYNKIWGQIYQKLYPTQEFKESLNLPQKLGLIAGLMLRNILRDDSVTKKLILDVFQAIDKRNQSIFAHGITSISKKNCEKLKMLSEQMITVIDFNSELKDQVFNQKMISNIIDLFYNIL